MPRGQCERGRRLYSSYEQKAFEMAVADGEKRASLNGASRDEWLELTRRAEEITAEYEKARHDYVEHMIRCKSCESEQLASLDLQEERSSDEETAVKREAPVRRR